METGMSPSGLVERAALSGPKFTNSESIPSRPESCCRGKIKSLSSRWNVRVGSRLAGKTDRLENERVVKRHRRGKEPGGTRRKMGRGRKEGERTGRCVCGGGGNREGES